MSKNPPQIVNSRLAAAVSHPTRAGAFRILSDREASPREIGIELDEPINNVTYHVQQLVKLGCAEPVRTAPVRGGRVVEHFYRATRLAWIDEDEWEGLGPTERHAFSTSVMRAFASDLNDAMAAGTFFEPDDKHLSRTPMTVDEEGWNEVKTLLNETLTSLIEIRSKVSERVETSGRDAIPIRVGMIQFRSPAKRKS